ncbi:MAG: heavy metal translocating P-type ATPase [Candidatus Wildermuthbacteria bacterium]|nr:heavy metal translocating P-type ATPase [Candidatus Wildermuthbacteria bacterium]
MHPEIQQDSPGMCPECGMNLVPAKQKAGKSAFALDSEHSRGARASEDKHAGHSTQMFLRKFWVSFILAIPVILYSELPKIFLNKELPQFPWSGYLALILGSMIFFYGGWVFLMGAWRELRGRLPGMMTLIGLAITAAYVWSVYATFAAEKPLFWELATLITIMLLGHWLEMKAVQGARGALKELAKLLPDKAEVIREGKTEIVPLEELKEKDVVLVKPGAKIPADGKILEGQSEVNESIVTGESKLVTKKIGDEVIAGTINGDGALQVEVTKIGEHTFLAGVMRLVAQAQASKSRLQILSDKAALYLTIVAVVAGTITLLAWLFAGKEVAFAVARLVAVLVIACPHALGLAVPLVASISTNMAASNGFLVKQRLALEAARNINVVLFDKTGTLTKGEFGVDAILAASGFNELEVLRLAASVNQYSEHAIAKAIVKDAKEKDIQIRETKNFQRIAGKGARAQIDGQEVVVGNETLLYEIGAPIEERISSRSAALASQGKTVVYVAKQKQLVGAIALADIIREESKETIQMLKEQGVRIAMITGDSDDVAKWVAQELQVDEYFARVLPEQKADKVKILQQRGLRVAMVGDGVNDAPALTQADLGIAIGAGTNVAIESAGIILVRNDPRDIPKIIRLSRLTYSKMMQNLFWATGYNVIALPLAAGALAFRGILLEPALAAVFMSLSTVIVAANAVLLKRKRL